MLCDAQRCSAPPRRGAVDECSFAQSSAETREETQQKTMQLLQLLFLSSLCLSQPLFTALFSRPGLRRPPPSRVCPPAEVQSLEAPRSPSWGRTSAPAVPSMFSLGTRPASFLGETRLLIQQPLWQVGLLLQWRSMMETSTSEEHPTHGVFG